MFISRGPHFHQALDKAAHRWGYEAVAVALRYAPRQASSPVQPEKLISICTGV
jgi:hypothetical protein